MIAEVDNDHLPAHLIRAFERLAKRGHTPEPPPWGRTVRLAVDYSLRVTIAGIQSDAAADAIATTCIRLAQLEKRDPRGDPPATCTAHEKARQAGPDYGRAFDLLGHIRDGSAEWIRHGWAFSALAPASMKILQRAARGERVREAELASVLEAAEHVTHELGRRLLTQPRGALDRTGLDQSNVS
jgi:hypothetical protein